MKGYNALLEVVLVWWYSFIYKRCERYELDIKNKNMSGCLKKYEASYISDLRKALGE